MFCSICGAGIADDAQFCSACGKPVGPAKGNGQPANDSVPEEAANAKEPEGREVQRVQANTLGEKLSDKLASTIAGKNIETIRISLEDMVGMIREHYITGALDDKEKKEILKAALGGSAFSAYGSELKSKDGAFGLSSYNAGHMGGKMRIMHPGESSHVQINEYSTGRIYRYYAFTLGKIKKALKAELR